MGSALSCLKPRKEGGAVRPVPPRRAVSASELQRPASSFSAGTSVTVEPKRRSVEVERPAGTERDSTEVRVVSAEKLVTPRALMEAMRKLDDGGDDVEDEEEAEGGAEEDDGGLPIAGSTSDDIGATGLEETRGLVDIHVRAEKALVTDALGVTDRESTAQLPDRAPSLQSMSEKISGAEDRPRKDGKKDVKQKKELQRSDTMLDVRSLLPVKMHVTNYEKIEAEARVDVEELVKSGRLQTDDASADPTS